MVASQWTMERIIGDLGGEIGQPSKPYANLAQRAVRRCQVNALKAMIPNLDESWESLPRGAQNVGDGYVLVRARKKNASRMGEAEVISLRAYLCDQGHELPGNYDPLILRWARL